MFAHPGDSYSFDATPPVLALPFLAPWGSTTEAVTLAKGLKPRYVVPIHDWYLEERGKGWLYTMAERALAEEGITLLRLDDFETVNVDVG